ncbi:hypothetical protein V2I01_25840 [Micromonospora sp. BRA006-A]|nr:hypothetical protein [Micromonospora sp. BRA006-A]
MAALLQPGDTILGLDLAHGGHLTHGMRINYSGRLYRAVSYRVGAENHLIDMDEVEELAREHRPKLLIAGWSAYPRTLDFARFRRIADQVDAYLLVDMAHFAGLVAAGLHPNPVPHAHVVTLTTHKTLGGPRAAPSSARTPISRGGWTLRSSRASKVVRWRMSWPRRRWPFGSPENRGSRISSGVP